MRNPRATHGNVERNWRQTALRLLAISVRWIDTKRLLDIGAVETSKPCIRGVMSVESQHFSFLDVGALEPGKDSHSIFRVLAMNKICSKTSRYVQVSVARFMLGNNPGD